ncbi:MAG: hypothetical protein ACK5GJ_11775 [Planctomycetota bacterium]
MNLQQRRGCTALKIPQKVSLRELSPKHKSNFQAGLQILEGLMTVRHS